MKFWAGVMLFFAIGAVIGLAVALALVDRGSSAAGAVVSGAFVGGYGAWLVFFVILNVLRWLRRPTPRTMN